jgi:hypothetical protein
MKSKKVHCVGIIREWQAYSVLIRRPSRQGSYFSVEPSDPEESSSSGAVPVRR